MHAPSAGQVHRVGVEVCAQGGERLPSGGGRLQPELAAPLIETVRSCNSRACPLEVLEPTPGSPGKCRHSSGTAGPHLRHCTRHAGQYGPCRDSQRRQRRHLEGAGEHSCSRLGGLRLRPESNLEVSEVRERRSEYATIAHALARCSVADMIVCGGCSSARAHTGR